MHKIMQYFLRCAFDLDTRNVTLQSDCRAGASRSFDDGGIARSHILFSSVFNSSISTTKRLRKISFDPNLSLEILCKVSEFKMEKQERIPGDRATGERETNETKLNFK